MISIMHVKVIRVNTEQQNIATQNLLFELGYRWEKHENHVIPMKYDPLIIYLEDYYHLEYSDLGWLQRENKLCYDFDDIIELTSLPLGSKKTETSHITSGYYIIQNKKESDFISNKLKKMDGGGTGIPKGFPFLVFVDNIKNNYRILHQSSLNIPQDETGFDIL